MKKIVGFTGRYDFLHDDFLVSIDDGYDTFESVSDAWKECSVDEIANYLSLKKNVARLVMKKALLRIKFKNRTLRAALLLTGDAILDSGIEGNELGVLLMEIRKELMNEK